MRRREVPPPSGAVPDRSGWGHFERVSKGPSKFCLSGGEELPIGESYVQVSIFWHDDGAGVPIGWYLGGETENYVLLIEPDPANPPYYRATLTPESQPATAPVSCQ